MGVRRLRLVDAIKFGIVATTALVMLATSGAAWGQAASGTGLAPADYQRMRSVGGAAISPDGKFVAYTVVRYDRPARPWPQLYVLDIAGNKSTRVGGEQDVSGSAVWSPDSGWVRVNGAGGGKHGVAIVHPDGSSVTFLTETSGTNAPLPGTGAEVRWSPDSKQIAFISATPGT